MMILYIIMHMPTTYNDRSNYTICLTSHVAESIGTTDSTIRDDATYMEAAILVNTSIDR